MYTGKIASQKDLGSTPQSNIYYLSNLQSLSESM